LTGTHARDWKGVAATHKPVAFKGVTILWTKDDGSITDIHVYLDVAAVKAQLGAPGPKELAGVPPVAAPTAPPQLIDQSEAGSPTETANATKVKAALDALENNDEAAYLAAMADDVEVYTLESAQPARGKEAAKAYFKAMRKAIGQLDTNLMGAWGYGNYAVVEYSVSGEQLGPIGWIPAHRDKVVRFEVVDVCELRDGKIGRVWRYDNPIQIEGE